MGNEGAEHCSYQVRGYELKLSFQWVPWGELWWVLSFFWE